MALATATVWIALFMFVKPAKGDTVDARKVYVIDGDTIALARERIRLLAIDAPETRDSRCERERVAGYKTKARVVDLLRFGRVVDIRLCTHAQTPEAIFAPKSISARELRRCEELGSALSAGLTMGIF